jgi:fluoroquinolone transport system permease protein
MNKEFIHLVKWDFIFFLRYHIITVAGIITFLYSVVFQMLSIHSDELITLIIFSDPAFLGFLFIGVILLYEKSAHTMQALAVTPSKLSKYIFSKALSLTSVAVLASMIMALAAKGFNFRAGYLFLAVALSSVVFILLGIVGISMVKTFNQYILVIPLFFAPAVLPILELFDFFTSPLFYLVPTKASLLLFEESFGSISVFERIYAIVYLLIWAGVSYKWAYKLLLVNWKNT